ncbi:hypothetical protein [Paenarthrobacter aurescens]|nr:hypothetical protein [Paenarthrobacter aurescens]
MLTQRPWHPGAGRLTDPVHPVDTGLEGEYSLPCRGRYEQRPSE